jgi:hypothetical protein
VKQSTRTLSDLPQRHGRQPDDPSELYVPSAVGWEAGRHDLQFGSALCEASENRVETSFQGSLGR